MAEAFQQAPWLFHVSLFAFGLVVGSFLNVVIYRLPVMMEKRWQRDCRELLEQDADTDAAPFNLVTPNSRCPACGHAIRPWENIPVLSWLALRGRCSGCSAAISPRYPAVELATAVATLAVGIYFGVTLAALAAIVLTWALVALSMIDADTKLLPDDITLPLLWLGLLANMQGLFVPLQDAVLGAMVGYLSLWSVYWLFKLLTGKEGMGYGDFKLLAALGAWLGWQAVPLIILLSSAVGAVFGVLLMLLQRRGGDTALPFGPYLAAAGWITLLWGEQLISNYRAMSGL